MCGIAGFLELKVARKAAALEAIGLAMGERIAHRGPDDCGVWSDPAAGICLSHRRLSIIDLSPAGHQPMISHDGRYVIVFNGEIYNHHDLRRKLESRAELASWRGRSDTEVLLEAIAQLGLDAALREATGMFAFALWDRWKRTLSLARDRAGEKPLYYGRVGTTFMFGSEIKALEAHPHWQPQLNRDVVASYLRYGYVPAPHSIYRTIQKLKPGHVLTATIEQLEAEPVSHAYWRFPVPEPARRTDAATIEGLDEVLRRAVGRQMEADVPLGCFLSGGIDSSLIASLAQAQSSSRIRTYTIGFDDPDHNEAPFAAAIAKHLGTDHTELYVSAEIALETAANLGSIYDEPFADSSQIPTLLLSRLTRQHVKVALSGDAGDELFGGYDRYDFLNRSKWVFLFVPGGVRAMAAHTLSSLPTDALQSIFARLYPSARSRLTATRMDRLATFLRYGSAYEAYKDLMSNFAVPQNVAPRSVELPTSLDDLELRRRCQSVMPWAAFIDAVTYLPDDILVKVDRASMAASLETRVPMLDPEVIAFAASIDWNTKTKHGSGKWPLKQLLARYVPRSLFDRPKRGFGVPLAQWLRGELRPWAESLLENGVGLIPEILDAAAVARHWREHLSGEHDHKSRLWALLMLQQWAVQHGVRG